MISHCFQTFQVPNWAFIDIYTIKAKPLTKQMATISDALMFTRQALFYL